MNTTDASGLWPLVILNAGVFIIFAFSFTHPHAARDWRSFGAFSAFVVALFTEMRCTDCGTSSQSHTKGRMYYDVGIRLELAWHAHDDAQFSLLDRVDRCSHLGSCLLVEQEE